MLCWSVFDGFLTACFVGTWAVLVVAGAFGGLGRVWVSLGSGLGWLIWCDFFVVCCGCYNC